MDMSLLKAILSVCQSFCLSRWQFAPQRFEIEIRQNGNGPPFRRAAIPGILGLGLGLGLG